MYYYIQAASCRHLIVACASTYSIRGATKFPSDRISCVHSACGCLRHVIVASRLVRIRSRGATEFPSDRISCDLHRKFCRNVRQNFLGNTVALIKSRDRIS